MPTFADQTIIVTGASSGIGRALCRALAADRPNLVLAARSADRLAEVAGECQARGAATLVVPTDVTSPDDCRRLVAAAIERFGQLDALVNNAGIGAWTRFADVTDLSIFERVMRVNYLGCVYCTHYALPRLKERGGRLVAVASVAGYVGSPMYTAYAPTKHAVVGFFDSLRMELLQERSDVSVTIVAPDFVESEIHASALGADGQPVAELPDDNRRFMPADRCAALVVRAMARRRRRAILSLRGRHALVGQAHVPWLVDWIVARVSRDWK
jgi:NAD(P)-dependent dehydrogenase (short-subunit alcohol dehydrogenase family)